MITYQQAEEIAWKQIISEKHEFVLDLSETIERPIGWVFFYTTKRYLETKDFMELVPGTAPFAVLRSDGSVHMFTSAQPYTISLKALENSLNKK